MQRTLSISQSGLGDVRAPKCLIADEVVDFLIFIVCIDGCCIDEPQLQFMPLCVCFWPGCRCNDRINALCIMYFLNTLDLQIFVSLGASAQY